MVVATYCSTADCDIEAVDGDRCMERPGVAKLTLLTLELDGLEWAMRSWEGVWSAIWRLRNVVCDVMLKQGFGEQVIDWDVEKALELGVVKVHGNDMVCSSRRDEVGDQSATLCDP
ncbi:hypothetical protein OGAPHI_003214 [Ogataea philodendri]|uniref:Uncharacterized protein n=1 Tax=Ogataea philodendri TaxID=1378263 RepID=A0A9P8P7Q6_9ASCO|nr:uncharacterized protein OGAPHI_003214 [Ogataea philodendri]KAH3666765.1 hypothetical protein OGAPHI_003214 [Ogataea philodendri]